MSVTDDYARLRANALSDAVRNAAASFFEPTLRGTENISMLGAFARAVWLAAESDVPPDIRDTAIPVLAPWTSATEPSGATVLGQTLAYRPHIAGPMVLCRIQRAATPEEHLCWHVYWDMPQPDTGGAPEVVSCRQAADAAAKRRGAILLDAALGSMFKMPVVREGNNWYGIKHGALLRVAAVTSHGWWIKHSGKVFATGPQPGSTGAAYVSRALAQLGAYVAAGEIPRAENQAPAE